MKAIAILFGLILASPAWAQQLTPEQNAAAALGQQIGLLTHDNVMLRQQLQQLSAENAKLKAELEKGKKDAK